jgi:hypothetical protein
MRKILGLAIAALGAQYVLKRRRGQQASDVWREATRP